jgi:hypothetical protein
MVLETCQDVANIRRVIYNKLPRFDLSVKYKQALQEPEFPLVVDLQNRIDMRLSKMLGFSPDFRPYLHFDYSSPAYVTMEVEDL